MKKCEACGAMLEDDVEFCGQCGAPVKKLETSTVKVCKNCGAILKEDSLFCERCVTPVEAVNTIAQPVQPQPAVSAAEPAPVKSEEKSDAKKAIDEYNAKVLKAGGELKKAGTEYAKIAGAAMQQTAAKAKEEIAKANAERDKCFVKLTEGEIVIRNYSVSKVMFPPMKGYLMVTNKRIVLYGSAFKSRIYQEVQIDSIGAIDSFYGFGINVFMLAVGLVILFARAFYMDEVGRYMNSTGKFYMFIFLIVGLFFVIFAFHNSLIIQIKSNKATGIGIHYGKTQTYGVTSILLKGRAGQDTDLMMSELGAILLDVQQYGEIGVKKWMQ